MAALDDEQYRALVEQAPSLFWRMGPDGERDYFNATWLAFTGRRHEQELGAGWLASVHPDDVGPCLAIQRDAFARRERFEMEYRLRRHDAEYRQVVDCAAPYLDAAGACAGFIGCCVDIEDRRAREESFGVNDFSICRSITSASPASMVTSSASIRHGRAPSVDGRGADVEAVREFIHPDDRAATLAGRKRLHVGSALGHSSTAIAAKTARTVGSDGAPLRTSIVALSMPLRATSPSRRKQPTSSAKHERVKRSWNDSWSSPIAWRRSARWLPARRMKLTTRSPT